MRLSARERGWLVEVFSTILPAPEPGIDAPAARDVDMSRFVDELCRNAPAQFGLGLRVAVWLVMLSPPLVLRRACTFAGLGADERIDLLERLGRSSMYVVRELPMLLKTVACLGYCGLPEVQAAHGIAPSNSAPPVWVAGRDGEREALR